MSTIFKTSESGNTSLAEIIFNCFKSRRLSVPGDLLGPKGIHLKGLSKDWHEAQGLGTTRLNLVLSYSWCVSVITVTRFDLCVLEVEV